VKERLVICNEEDMDVTGIVYMDGRWQKSRVSDRTRIKHHQNRKCIEYVETVDTLAPQSSD